MRTGPGGHLEEGRVWVVSQDTRTLPVCRYSPESETEQTSNLHSARQCTLNGPPSPTDQTTTRKLLLAFEHLVRLMILPAHQTCQPVLFLSPLSFCRVRTFRADLSWGDRVSETLRVTELPFFALAGLGTEGGQSSSRVGGEKGTGTLFWNAFSFWKS
jgi:hypothetical protein